METTRDIWFLGPSGEFSNVFGYLIENQYKLEHFKSTSD
jgi:hypothetical protein